MGKMKDKPILPKVFASVGAMIDARVSISAKCRKCNSWFKVDLGAVAAVKGRDYSLIGKHPVCRLLDCDGRCLFIVGHDARSIKFPLDRWSDFD